MENFATTVNVMAVKAYMLQTLRFSDLIYKFQDLNRQRK